jgi:Pentapeptide repeats (8 copies)
MIVRKERERPLPWAERRRSVGRRWVVPFAALEWVWEWAAYGLSNWTFIEVLEYLETFSVLVAVIFYFAESGDRVKQRHYQAWQVINTAQGKGGSGGRIEALQELNADKVPLVGVDASSAFLQGLRLKRASLVRADLSSADLRGSDFSGSDMTWANLEWANFRGARLNGCKLAQVDLREADLSGASLDAADLTGAALDDADLRGADLAGVVWAQVKSVKGANIAGARNAPMGFREWALKNGAVELAGGE